ncbi:MAG: GNAT family N-acetyltransferase [Steroidobacteraceae bacterium]
MGPLSVAIPPPHGLARRPLTETLNVAMHATLDFGHPRTEADWHNAQILIHELIEWDVSQSRHQGFDRAEVVEIFYPDTWEDIRAHSAEPGGGFLLATAGGNPAGCAAFKRLSPEVCELYSVYVRPDFRGQRIASHLISRLKKEAFAIGYLTMYLETATFMSDAHRLYRAHGFKVRHHYRPLPPRHANAIVSMQCDLSPPQEGAT